MGIMSAKICFGESDYHCFDVDHHEIVFWGKPFLSKGNLINLAFSAENYILGNVTIYSALAQCVKLLKIIETQIIYVAGLDLTRWNPYQDCHRYDGIHICQQ